MMKGDDSSKRLISNSFFLMADWISAMVLSMIFWLIVGKTMATSGYGIIATAINIALLIAAFGMVGVRDAATNLISRYLKKGAMEKVRGVIKFSSKFVLIGNVISGGVVAALSPQLAEILNLPIELMWLVSIMIFAWAFWLLTTGFLQGMQNMKLLFKTNLIGQIVKVVLPVAMFFIGIGFLSPMIAFIISLLLVIVLRIKYLPFGKSSPVNGKEIIFKLSLPVFISSVMWLVFTNMPNVILNSVTSSDVTGLFALVLTLATPIVFIPMTLGQALFPITSGLEETSNPQKRQSKLISLVLKFAAFMTFPLIVLLLVFSNEIILFFSQPIYLPASELIPIVAPASILLGVGQILVYNIFAIGRPKVTRNITILTTALFLALSIPASYMFSGLGMAYAYLISMIVLVLTSYFYLRGAINLKVDWASILKIFAAAMLFAAFTHPLNMLFNSVVVKIAIIVIGLILYFAILLPLRYYTLDEVKVLQHLTSRSRSLKKRMLPFEKLLMRYV